MTRSIPALTGVRGLAAVWVLGYHMQLLVGGLGLGRLANCPILRDGWVGVDLFFLLSGFVLMQAHGEAFRALSWTAVGRFATNRALRLYPLATVVLVLVSVTLAMDRDFVRFYRTFHSPADFTLLPFVRTLTLSTRWFGRPEGEWNEPVWSVSAEIVGYAAFPLLAYLIAKVRAPRAAGLIGILALLILVDLTFMTGRADVNHIDGWSLVRMGFCLVGGMALARARRTWPPGCRKWAGWVAALGAVGLVSGCFLPHTFVVALFASAAIVFGVSFEAGVVNRVLSSRVAVWLGKISFPLYLVHVMPLIWLQYIVFKWAIPAPGAFGLLVAWAAASFALAHLLHRFVERPSHLLARRLSRPSAEPPTFDGPRGRLANLAAPSPTE